MECWQRRFEVSRVAARDEIFPRGLLKLPEHVLLQHDELQHAFVLGSGQIDQMAFVHMQSLEEKLNRDRGRVEAYLAEDPPAAMAGKSAMGGAIKE